MRRDDPWTPRSSTRTARTSGVGRAAPHPSQRQWPRWPSITIEYRRGRGAGAAADRVGGVGEGRERDGRVVDAEREGPRAPLGQLGDRRVVGVQHRRGALAAGPRPCRPSARPASPARRTGRAGRGRGSSARSTRGRSWRATSGRAASSTSNSPAWGAGRRARASSRAVATPDSRLAPDGLAARSQPASRAHEETRRAVVVLPLVAEISVTPWGSTAPSSATRLRPQAQQDLARQARPAAAPEAPRQGPGGAGQGQRGTAVTR